MENQKGVILGILIAILIVLVGIYLLSDIGKTGDSDNGGTATTTGDEILDLLGLEGEDVDVEIIPVENPDIEVPDTDRPLPSGASESVKQKITELTDMLEDDPNNYKIWIDIAAYRRVGGDFRRDL